MKRIALVLALVAAALGLLGTAEPASAASTITVNASADTVRGPISQISLRKAINQAVADGQNTTIRLQAGVLYNLTRCALRSEDANSTGDLDVAEHDGTLTIIGNGATIHQTCAGERVLDLADPGVVLQDLTITGGNAATDAGDTTGEGGGIRATGGVVFGLGAPFPTGIELTLTRVDVTGNTAAGTGGGIAGFPPQPGPGLLAVVRVRAVQSEISGNTSGVFGGGIAGTGPISLVDSSVVGNTAAEVGGVRATTGIGATDSTIADNTETPATAPSGDAVELDAPITIALTHTTVRAGEGTGPAVSVDDLTARASVIDSGAADAACAITGDLTTNGANADDDGSCGFDAGTDQSGVTDLGLGAVGEFGGRTPTIRPTSTSPLLDREPSASCPLPDSDQRGVDRAGPACDTGSVELRGRADGLLRLGASGAFVGDNVFRSDGHGQIVSPKPRVGQTVNVTLRLQNDGERADVLTLHAPGSNPRFTVTYTRGHANVTSAVVAGTYASPTLAVGHVDTVTMSVTVRNGTPVGTVRNLLAVVGSTASPTATDTLAVNVKTVA